MGFRFAAVATATVLLAVFSTTTFGSSRHAKSHMRADVGLTDEQKQRVVDRINQVRSHAGASNMNKLVWNDQLAQVGKQWADQCVFKHRDLNNPGGAGYVDPSSIGFGGTTIGENIWARSADDKPIPDFAIEEWYNEKHDYHFSSASCNPGRECGHYIALMWAYTREIGCGLTHCASLQTPAGTWPGGVMLSCNMAPGADPSKQPFAVGPVCTECISGHSYCTHGLCDNSCHSTGYGGTCECKAHCQHGSATGDCGCNCQAGYMGAQCDDVCQDLAYDCGVFWPDMFCDKSMLEMMGPLGLSMYETINNSCPKMCGHCVGSKRSSSSSHRSRSSSHHRHHSRSRRSHD